MDNNNELIEALNQIESEKGIDKEVIFEAIETSLVTACKKNFGQAQNVKVIIDRTSGKVDVFAQKTVVDVVKDSITEISLDDAKEISSKYQLGDIADIVVTPRDFGRISAQTAKQVVVQKFREAERILVYNEFKGKEKEIVTGIVQRYDRKNVIVALGKNDLILAPNEQIPKEQYTFNSRIKVYVLEVKETTKGPLINVSRTHPELVKRLFEQEVPEIYDGTVEVKSIAREAGSRTKISVYSKHPDVDPVGACVGANGQRVNIIVGELNGEKIDVIPWDEDPRKFIANALSPSRVLAVVVNSAERTAKIVVPDHQLSLAIGKEGQNVRLAAKLTGYRIDIKSETKAKEINFIDEEELIGKEPAEISETVETTGAAQEEYADDGYYYDEYDEYYDDYDDEYDYDDYEDYEEYEEYEEEPEAIPEGNA